MKEPSDHSRLAWTASVYYVEILVNCDLARAWEIMLDYKTWSPGYTEADITTVRGTPHTEGEIVLVSKPLLMDGEPLPQFYTETVKVVPHQHLVGYAYPREGRLFRNFIDFGLSKVSSGVRFDIHYYEQNLLSGDALIKHRKEFEQSLQTVAAAFKSYCEAKRGEA